LKRSSILGQLLNGYDDAIQALSAARRVLVTTHVRPDGDALGSTTALLLALRAKAVAADLLTLSPVPSKYAFVLADAGVEARQIAKDLPPDFSLDAYDTFVSVDTGTWSQLPGLEPHVERFTGRKVVIDHHLTQGDWADVMLVVKDAAAAGEIVADLIERWGVPLTPPMAQALYVALVSDTGWFQFSSTRPGTLRLAARLLEAGVDNDRVYQLLYQNERPQRIALQTRGQSTLELLADNRVAVMTIAAADFAATGGTVNDTEGVVNYPLQVRTVQVSVLLTQPPEGGPVRISFRSKGQIDVAQFAEQFGGGGHARAAGAKFTGTLDAAKATVVERLLQTLA
jgi:phosphoesterase RecJ-like protein